MRPMIWVSIWFSALLWLSGCQTHLEANTSALLNGVEYVPIEGKDSKDPEKNTLDMSQADRISGSGKIVFNLPMEGGQDSHQSFHASVQLLEEGSAFTLYTFSHSNLVEGVELSFSRKEGKIQGAYRIGLNQEVIKEELLAGFSVDAPLVIDVLVDNRNSKAELSLFRADSETPLYTTADSKIHLKGANAYWGFGIIKATVTEAKNIPGQ